MRASDSTNSLTGLKESVSTNSLADLPLDENTCFICITVDNELGEPLVNSSMLRTCGCRFYVHPYCWNLWMKGKSDFDCPICHKKSITDTKRFPTPTQVFVAQNPLPEEEPNHNSRCIIGICSAIAIFTTIFSVYFIYAK